MGDKKRYNNIVDDVETILKLKVTRNRKKMVEILSLLKEIIVKLKQMIKQMVIKTRGDKTDGDETDDKQPDNKI